jgi:drug/metabolite transporter (DMT)-like permease
MRLGAKTADWALVGITAIWGATFVTVKGALDDTEPFTFLALRFACGALAAAVLARRSRGDARVWRVGGFLGLLLFGGFALQTFGLLTISASRSAFLTGLSVLMVPFTSRALARVTAGPPSGPIAWTTWAAIAVALVGLVLLTGVTIGGALAVGDLLTLACAGVYAWHIAAMGRMTRGMSPVAVVAVQLLVTALLSAAAASLAATPWAMRATPRLWGAVLTTGILASALAISVQAWAQERTAPERAALIYALEPVFAVLFAAAIGAGLPSLREAVGGALIIAAVVFSEVSASSKHGAERLAGLGVLTEREASPLDAAEE